ncbi:MAG: amidohydrolase family protein [Desulfobulbaceae bacterium]|nr:amidohydrolase family protein [Desulfobulbaceae bacterium]
MPCIDFHTHAFPDALAETTVPALEKKGNVSAALDGRVSSLVTSMDRAGVDKSVICSIATRPAQFRSIINWSHSIQNERIIPFPSFHPASPNALDEIETIHQEGFKGVKLHPYYQDFFLDEKRLETQFEKISDLGLIVVMHTGFDIGFPRELRADPSKIANLMKIFPNLKFIATHMGSWQQWDEVLDILAGKNVYLDIAFSLEYLSADKALQIINSHSADKLLFGSDSPWADQLDTINLLKSLKLKKTLEEKILGGNAERLLSS